MLSSSGRLGPCRPAPSRQVICDASSNYVRRAVLSSIGAGSLHLISSRSGYAASESGEIPSAPDEGAAGPGPGSTAAAVQEVPARRRLQPVPRTKLKCGLEVSQIIKGCWQLDGAHRGDAQSDRTSGADAVADFERFFMAGVSSLDTADIYGPSEALVGQFLRLNPWLRDEVQVSTKITCMEEDMAHLSRDMLEYKVTAAMRRMGVAQLDLVQLHWEDLNVKGYVDAAKWLADMKGRGLINHIGLTNFDTPHMIQVLDAGVKIASNQVQYSLLDRRAELYMADLCGKKGIALLPYGVLAGGFLSSSYLGKAAGKVPVNTMSKAKYGAQLKELGGWTYLQEVLQGLKPVADKHGVSVSAVAIRWVLQQECVPAAIIGARNASHVKDLQSVFTFELDEDDLFAIDALYEGATNQPSSDIFVWERGGAW